MRLLATELSKAFVADDVISAEVLELCGVSTHFFGESHEFECAIKHTIVICRYIRNEICRV